MFSMHSVLFCRQIVSGPHTMWMDNYSKNVKWQCPDVAKGTFHQGLWTGFAVRACTADVSMKFVLDQTGSVVPAMPDDPFTFKDMVQDGLLKSMFDRGDRSNFRFRSSLVFKWKVNNVPLRPQLCNVPNVASQARYRAGLERHADSLDHLHPLKLLDINCGENVGFAMCFERLSTEKNWTGRSDQPSCDTYTSMFMDCDLFDKCVKVLHSIFFHIETGTPSHN